MRSVDLKPATKGDIRKAQEELALMLANSFDRVATKDELKNLATKDELKNLATDVHQVRRSQEAILDVVRSIDEQLKEHNTHPARIARLERSVFR